VPAACAPPLVLALALALADPLADALQPAHAKISTTLTVKRFFTMKA
jgi:hypothetical protein